MTTEFRALLEGFVLGTLSPSDQSEFEAELAKSPSLRDEVKALEEGVSALALALPPATLRSSSRARLLDAVGGPNRFLPFFDDLSRHLDLGEDDLRAVLARVDEPKAWQSAPFPGVTLSHFKGGPRVAAFDTGLVRFEAGTAFPEHRHLGPELNYVLEGCLHNSDGSTALPGDCLELPAGSAHHFSVPKDREALIVVIHQGFEFVT